MAPRTSRRPCWHTLHHRDAVWEGHQLRVGLEAKGIKLPRGLHAKNDSHPTRGDVYATLAAQVRFDASLLKKSAAYPNARAAGKVRLFKMAIWLHLKHVIPLVSATGDRIFVIAGHLQTSGHRDAIVTGSTTSVSRTPSTALSCRASGRLSPPWESRQRTTRCGAFRGSHRERWCRPTPTSSRARSSPSSGRGGPEGR